MENITDESVVKEEINVDRSTVIETIINKFYNELINDSERIFLYFDLSIDEMSVKIENKLNNIQEFSDLNLSQNEIDAGITVDDPN